MKCIPQGHSQGQRSPKVKKSQFLHFLTSDLTLKEWVASKKYDYSKNYWPRCTLWYMDIKTKHFLPRSNLRSKVTHIWKKLENSILTPNLTLRNQFLVKRSNIYPKYSKRRKFWHRYLKYNLFLSRSYPGSKVK